MKFTTQHIKVVEGKTGYDLHRDGKVTWKTQGFTGDAYDTVVHDSVAKAKALFGTITS